MQVYVKVTFYINYCICYYTIDCNKMLTKMLALRFATYMFISANVENGGKVIYKKRAFEDILRLIITKLSANGSTAADN